MRYTWKVVTTEHDRGLEAHLNKANSEQGWEIVFILPGGRPGHSIVVARKSLEAAAPPPKPGSFRAGKGRK